MDAKNSSLLYYSSTGNTKRIQDLINEGVDVNFKDCDGNSAIFKAAEKNHGDVVKLLLQNGAEINAVNNNNNTAMHVAVICNSIEIVKLLMENNIKMNIFNNEEKTSLMCAMDAASCANIKREKEFNSRIMILEFLLEQDKDELRQNHSDLFVKSMILYLKNDYESFHGSNHLFYAIHVDCFLAVEKILNKDPDLLNSQDGYGHFPIHVAANNKIDILKLILSTNKEMIDQKDVDGNTPLHHAVQHHSLDTIMYLIEQNANVNIPNKLGNISLHSAIMAFTNCCLQRMSCRKYQKSLKMIELYLVDFQIKCSHLAVAVYLIEKGNANVTLRNYAGKSPLDLWKGETGVCEFLTEKYMRNNKNSNAVNANTVDDGCAEGDAFRNRNKTHREIMELVRGAHASLDETQRLRNIAKTLRQEVEEYERQHESCVKSITQLKNNNTLLLESNACLETKITLLDLNTQQGNCEG